MFAAVLNMFQALSAPVAADQAFARDHKRARANDPDDGWHAGIPRPQTIALTLSSTSLPSPRLSNLLFPLTVTMASILISLIRTLTLTVTPTPTVTPTTIFLLIAATFHLPGSEFLRALLRGWRRLIILG